MKRFFFFSSVRELPQLYITQLHLSFITASINRMLVKDRALVKVLFSY